VLIGQGFQSTEIVKFVKNSFRNGILASGVNALTEFILWYLSLNPKSIIIRKILLTRIILDQHKSQKIILFHRSCINFIRL